ncbi:hypothetical protein L0B70_02420 [Kaistella sp. 97-N-M2]|uniref:hypothetical protein n=1 Tax=Kaistella sp. 97-N-M2 TaxID=2908645 RepID=UPI001F3C4AF2|nr:hypothetical protein [Kaistella sp. 97-N-M2]UJF30272.1 hypothetical protein L0B70_02420 [Kaistella sp. 97-N-M2]
MQIEKIEFGRFYHIFNKGNNSEDIFFEEENYRYFLKLLAKYILPVSEIYCYCLLRNRFHLVVRIKEKEDLVYADFTYSTVDKPKDFDASRQFSHFFNAYTLAINKRYRRSGSLLEKPFERKLILDDNQLKQTILHIHHIPLINEIVENTEDYKWSSYRTILSNTPTKIQRRKVLEYFDGKENFIFCHQNS